MRIMFVCLNMRAGGAERVTANLANYLANQSHKISIISCVNEPSYYDLNHGVHYEMIDTTYEEQFQGKAKRLIRRRNALRKRINTLKPDIILAFLPEVCVLTLSLKPFLKSPVIISERNDPGSIYKSVTYKLLVRFFYPQADWCVFQLKDAMSFFSKGLRKKSTIIPNPINTDFSKLSWNGINSKKVVMVGRLNNQKNVSLAINAWSRFLKNNPDYKIYELNIYGEGEERKKIKAQISMLNLTNVKLMGNTKNIGKVLQNARLFLMTSDYEGMPNSLMEAMAVGVPCISTDCPCGGPRFLMQDGNGGVLVSVGDEIAIASAIENMLNNSAKSEAMSNNEREITERLCPEKIFSEWEKVITMIVERSERK